MVDAQRAIPPQGKLAKSVLLLACFAALMLCPRRASAASVGVKAGVGTGLAYGSPFPGVGVELELGQYASVTGGASGITGAMTWSFGARLYFRNQAHKWRPHVSLFRWTDGNAFYGGVDHDIGEPSGFNLTYGVGYGDVNLEGRFGLMLGLGYRF